MSYNPLINNLNTFSTIPLSRKTVKTDVNPTPSFTPVSEPISSKAADAIKAQTTVSSPMQYIFIKDINISFANPAKFYKLANGQKVIILNKKGPTVVKSYFNVGSLNEPDDIRGVSHFDEHMMFNGSPNIKPGEFFKITNNMGAATNASTSFSQTDYFIESQMLADGDLEKTIKLHAEMLQYPEYNVKMVEKEKGPVTQEISMVADEPQNTALNNCIKNLFGIESSSPDLIAGSIKNINNMTKEKALNYYNTWYTPDNCTTVIVGEVDEQQTIDYVSKYFNKKNPSKTKDRKYTEFKPTQAPIRNDFILPKAQSNTIVLGFAGPVNNSEKERIELDLLMAILFEYKDARINKSLNQLHSGGIYSIERVGNRPADPSAILLLSQTTPEKSEKVLNAFYKEIQNINQQPITKEELERAKNLLELTFSKITENAQSLNSLIGISMLNGTPNLPENYINILNSITPQDLTNFAKKYLDLNKVSVSVVHPESNNQAQIIENYKKANSVSFKGRLEEKTFDQSKLKHYKLHNNMELVINPNESDIVNFKTVLDTHYPANANPAAALILYFMLNEGSQFKNYAQFYDEPNRKGSQIKFYADFNSITANVNSLAKNADEAMKLVKEALLYPRFNEKSFDYAKSMVKEIIDNTQPTASDNALSELFTNIPNFADKESVKSSLQHIKMSDVIGLYQYIIQNADAKTVVTGNIEKYPEIVNNTIQNFSQNMPMFKPISHKIFESYVPIPENKIITKAEARAQADITQSFKFKTNFNPKDQLTFNLVNTILGGGTNSRLFNDLREKQKLAYRVESLLDFVGNTGLITLAIKTTTDNPSEGVIAYDNVKKSLDGFKKHIELIKNEKVSDEELADAKLRIKTNLLNAIESSDGQTQMLADSIDSYFSTTALEENLKLIDEITAEDIQQAANLMFNSNSLTSILASQKTLNHMNLDGTKTNK